MQAILAQLRRMTQLVRVCCFSLACACSHSYARICDRHSAHAVCMIAVCVCCRLWPVRALTAFAAVDTVGTVAVAASVANHTDQFPEEYRMLFLGGFAMFACVPPVLLASLQWIRTRLVTSVVESGREASVSAPLPSSSSSADTTITLGFASLLPGGVGSQRSFGPRDLRTEYDGGIAYLVVQDAEAARAAGLPTSYVLDPIEMANVWSDEEQARRLFEFMNRMGE